MSFLSSLYNIFFPNEPIMRCNEQGLAIIKEFEGCRLSAYQDQNNVWTIGYGHTAGVKEGDVCTQEQADAYMVQDLANVEAGIAKLVKKPLSSNQFSALCSFVYNIGLSHFNASTALAFLNMGNMAKVPVCIAWWCKTGGEPNKGLIRRRSAEVKLFNTPD
jgi:lysozyme